MRKMLAIMLLNSCVGAWGISARAENPAEASVPQLAKLRSEINTLIGNAQCSNLVNCRIAGLGARPCGGAAEYIAFSWINTDRAGIDTKVAEYNIVYDDYLSKQPQAGACVVLPEPVANCVRNRCVIPGAH